MVAVLAADGVDVAMEETAGAFVTCVRFGAVFLLGITVRWWQRAHLYTFAPEPGPDFLRGLTSTRVDCIFLRLPQAPQ